MNAIKNILVPFDFSPLAKNALRYATNYCINQVSTEITLLYCSNDKNHDEKSAMMTAAIESTKVPSNIHLIGKVIKSELTAGILDCIKEVKPHILIMGTKGSKSVSEKATTNTAKITLEAACPVIVVPESYKGYKLKDIALAIGVEEIDDPEVLTTLLVMARRFDARIKVLCITADENLELADTKTERVLEYYFEKFYTDTTYISSSNIAESILKYDETHAIDLLAIIPRNHIKHGDKSQGRLTSFLTMNSNIPLLTMNQPH